MVIIGSIFQNLKFYKILKLRLLSKSINRIIAKSMHFYQIDYHQEKMNDDQIEMIKNVNINIKKPIAIIAMQL